MHTPKTLSCLIPMAQPCFSCSWQERTCPTTFTPTLRHWGGGHRQICFCNWSWAIEWLLPYPLRHSDLTIHKNKVPSFNYHLRYFKEPHFTFFVWYGLWGLPWSNEGLLFFSWKTTSNNSDTFLLNCESRFDSTHSAIIASYIRISPGIHFVW